MNSDPQQQVVCMWLFAAVFFVYYICTRRGGGRTTNIKTQIIISQPIAIQPSKSPIPSPSRFPSPYENPIFYEPQIMTCPYAFGVGHQKSGTTTILASLASMSNLTWKNDNAQFWNNLPLNDNQIIRALDNEPLQKEGHAIHYLEDIIRICPQTKIYVVERPMIDVVRSVADRLQITEQDICPLERIPKSWSSIFQHSNSSSCVERIAHSWLWYQKRLKEIEKGKRRFIYVSYNDYNKSKEQTIRKLCQSLKLMCNGSVDNKQYQPKGKHRDQPIKTIWSKELVEKLEKLSPPIFGTV